jgi:hypothetical protein
MQYSKNQEAKNPTMNSRKESKEATMGTRHLTLMGAAVLAVSVLGAGCSRKSETSGEGSARISALNLAYSDTTKVTVTIESDPSGANLALPSPSPLWFPWARS